MKVFARIPCPPPPPQHTHTHQAVNTQAAEGLPFWFYNCFVMCKGRRAFPFLVVAEDMWWNSCVPFPLAGVRKGENLSLSGLGDLAGKGKPLSPGLDLKTSLVRRPLLLDGDSSLLTPGETPDGAKSPSSLHSSFSFQEVIPWILVRLLGSSVKWKQFVHLILEWPLWQRWPCISQHWKGNAGGILAFFFLTFLS